MTEPARVMTQANGPGEGRPKPEQRSADPMSRIKLALLEQYSQQNEKQGSDPYNTNSPTQDQWRGNARRM